LRKRDKIYFNYYEKNTKTHSTHIVRTRTT
jgi:hypothetical protein